MNAPANLPALVAGRELDEGKLAEVTKALEVASTLEDLHALGNWFDLVEQHMREAGYTRATEQLRPINELRFRARWKLGRVLAGMERGTGPGRGKKGVSCLTSFRRQIGDLGLDKTRAMECQHIGAMPEAELEKAFAKARERDILNTVPALIDHAWPWWCAASRAAKHRKIAAEAIVAQRLIGRYSLICADPPWRFEVYNPVAADSRVADNHYPTLSDHEIIHFEIDGRRIDEIAHEAAALFLWCTSSNLERALAVMKAWGFAFRASAVWVKDRTGTGLVFRNRHEMLLYGVRGDMPGPVWQPPSVFEYPRGVHSSKPPEIRAAIERMYPDFYASTRLELFARGEIPGWTCRGLEAKEARGTG